jgi:hypothetical protein
MNILKNLSYIAIILALSACGGSEGSGEKNQIPSLPLSTDFTSVEINENQTTTLNASYPNPVGDVSFTVGVPDEHTNDIQYTISQKENTATIALSVPELQLSKIFSVTISAIDSSGTTLTENINITAINSSALELISKLTIIKENVIALINAEEEKRLMHAISKLAYFGGQRTLDEKSIISQQISDTLDPAIAELITKLTNDFSGDSFNNTEDNTKALLSAIENHLLAYITPTNDIITDTLNKVSREAIQSISLGEYYFDSEKRKYSQLWQNPELSDNETQTFKEQYLFLTDIVFSDEFTCNDSE